MDGDRKGLVVHRQMEGLLQPEGEEWVLSGPDTFPPFTCTVSVTTAVTSLSSLIVTSGDFARVRCLAHITVCLRTRIPKDPS